MPNKFFTISKIVSGGQTGVDRAAWDFALANGIEIGGYVPNGRLAEDGLLDPKYGPLMETNSADPAERTEMNVINSDATLLLHRGKMFGGTELTREIAIAANKPHFSVARARGGGYDLKPVKAWLERVAPTILNIAGPRETDCPGIYVETLEFLTNILTE